MRRYIGLLLASIMIMSIPSFAFAYSEYQVGIDDIDNIVVNKSTFKMEVDKKIADSNGDYLKAISQSAQAASVMAGIKDKKSPEYLAAYEDYIASTKRITEAEYNLKSLRLTENMGLFQQGQTAKETYLGYWQKTADKEKAQLNIDKQVKQIKIIEKKYKKGLVARSVLEDAREKKIELEEKLEDIVLEIDKSLVDFKIALGVMTDDKVGVKPLDNIEFGYTLANNASLERDLTLRLATATDILVAKLEVEKAVAMTYYNSNEHKKAINDLSKVTNKVKTDFISKYSGLKIEAKKVLNSNRSISVAYKKYKKTLAKYKKGYTTISEVNTKKDEYLEQVSNAKDSKRRLIESSLKYELLKKGY
ncbi:MAG: hypothetical protein RR495_05025 [Anaerovoracaceae bacterium]